MLAEGAHTKGSRINLSRMENTDWLGKPTEFLLQVEFLLTSFSLENYILAVVFWGYNMALKNGKKDESNF